MEVDNERRDAFPRYRSTAFHGDTNTFDKAVDSCLPTNRVSRGTADTPLAAVQIRANKFGGVDARRRVR